MEPNEDSIKLLEMRIRHQMNRSLEKKIMPENIHYYLSSSATQRSEELQPDIHDDEQEQPKQMIHVDGKGNLWQEIQVGEKAGPHSDILTDGAAGLQQDIPIDGTAGLQPGILSDTIVGLQPDIQTDGKAEGLQTAYDKEIDSSDRQEYEDSPFDAAEYIDRVSEISQRIEHIEISETKEVQHAKARNGYESTRRSMDAEQSSGIGKKHFLDAKG